MEKYPLNRRQLRGGKMGEKQHHNFHLPPPKNSFIDTENKKKKLSERGLENISTSREGERGIHLSTTVSCKRFTGDCVALIYRQNWHLNCISKHTSKFINNTFYVKDQIDDTETFWIHNYKIKMYRCKR